MSFSSVYFLLLSTTVSPELVAVLTELALPVAATTLADSAVTEEDEDSVVVSLKERPTSVSATSSAAATAASAAAAAKAAVAAARAEVSPGRTPVRPIAMANSGINRRVASVNIVDGLLHLLASSNPLNPPLILSTLRCALFKKKTYTKTEFLLTDTSADL